MPSNPTFLTVAQVLTVHQFSVENFGGIPGVRSQELLESAVIMPQQSFAGQRLHEGLPAMGAAYMFHLLKNHPFADGNKRTRTLCALVFLRENGLEAFPPDPKVEELAQGVAGGTISKDELTTYWESWVASN